jgi:hypothetical protein
MDGKTVVFDFEQCGFSVDSNDPRVLHVEQRWPDSSYIELNTYKITTEMIRKVEEIKEFFVFTGEEGETDLKPVEVENITFVLPDDGWRDVHVKADVCRSAKVCSNIN